MSDQWLSIVEYARYYNLSDMTVRRRIKTGKLRAVLKEGKYYIPLKSFAGEHRVAAEQRISVEHRGTFNEEQINIDPYPHHPTDPHSTPIPNNRPITPHRHFGMNLQEQNQNRVEQRSFGAHSANKPRNSSFPHPRSHPTSALNSRGTSPNMVPSLEEEFAAIGGMTNSIPDEMNEIQHIPTNLISPLIQNESILIESKALLSFCEKVLQQFKDSEKKLEGEFQNKVQILEAQTKNLEMQLLAKEVKLNELQQQVEDLQVLIKIIEKHKTTNCESL